MTQFTGMIDQLKDRYEQVCAVAGRSAEAADMTVVFDAGQNSEANFAHFAATGLHYIGSVPASDCPDLTGLPASERTIVDEDRFGGLTAYDTRRVVYGTERRAILTHSPELRDSQARGFDGTTLAKAGKKLDELAATLARGKTRRPRDQVEAEIASITAKPWVRRVILWDLTGTQPKDLRLAWHVDPDARAALEDEIFGREKHEVPHAGPGRNRGRRHAPPATSGRPDCDHGQRRRPRPRHRAGLLHGRAHHRHHNAGQMQRYPAPHRGVVPPPRRSLVPDRHARSPQLVRELARQSAVVVHLKHGVTADLPATARPVDEPTRRRVISAVLDLQDRPDVAARVSRRQDLNEWLAHSPLIEIVFDDGELRTASAQRNTAT